MSNRQSIQFLINVQHDCRVSECSVTGVRPQVQERKETSHQAHYIVHTDDSRFIINTHGLHNSSLLRKYLPRDLTAPRPLFVNRRERHFELAARLRVQQDKKRIASKEKSAATHQKKKQATARSGGRDDTPMLPSQCGSGVEVGIGQTDGALEEGASNGRAKRKR
jgi:hypothetical protein